MEIITSFTNKTVKYIASLCQKKRRAADGVFVAEGYKNVLDTVSALPENVVSVVMSESFAKMHADEFSEFNVSVTTDSVFSKMSETECSQGVLAVMEVLPEKLPESERCILLDRVRDPGNVGTILRTAAACGYDVIVNNCADIYSPKVTRSSMSALLKCRICSNEPPESIKKLGYELIAADMSGGNLFSMSKPSGKYCIVIGNEADGVSEEILGISDRTVAIPMENMESLNAAITAAVMMFELRYGIK